MYAIRSYYEAVCGYVNKYIDPTLQEVTSRITANENSISTGWQPTTATITYSSADSPTFVANTATDLTGLISVGMRLKLTQTTVKYFIVTAITSTKITLYGGTDYTLANSTISNVYFSNVKAPLGFPLSPDKWSVKTVINTDIQQVSPTTNTWYNLGAKNIALPIGVWHLYFKSFISPYRTTAGGLSQLVTLSTANNSESNKNLTNYTSVRITSYNVCYTKLLRQC